MGSAGESTTIDRFARARAAMTEALAGLRVDGLSAQQARACLDHVLAVEKAVGSVKVLLADRASAGSTPKRAAQDLARRSGSSVSRARKVLDASKKVSKQPQVRDALENGSLSEEQATAIADAAAANPGATKSLLEKARNEGLGSLRESCGRAKAAADRDAETTHRRIHEGRFFRHGTDAEGAFTASIRCTVRDGATLLAHLKPFREQIFTANRAKGVRDSYEAIDLDALVAMAEASTDNASGTRARAQVNVVVDWHALVGLGHDHLGDEPPAYLAGAGPIPMSVVREILEDAFLVGLLREGTDITKVRRFGRHIPVEVRDAVMVNARFQCATPGCTHWARLEMDHIHPFAHGGETSATNLEPLCTTCHRAKTARDRLFDDTG